MDIPTYIVNETKKLIDRHVRQMRESHPLHTPTRIVRVNHPHRSTMKRKMK